MSYNIDEGFIEEKAKVVAASWGTELLRFLAALAILHQDNLGIGAMYQDELNYRGKISRFFNSS